MIAYRGWLFFIERTFELLMNIVLFRAIIQDNVNGILTNCIIIRDSSDYITRTMGRVKESKATKPQKQEIEWLQQ